MTLIKTHKTFHFIIQSIGHRRRTVFIQSHIQQLDNVFTYNQYPDIDLRESLAAQMGISQSRIQVFNFLTLKFVKYNLSCKFGSKTDQHVRVQCNVDSLKSWNHNSCFVNYV